MTDEIEILEFKYEGGNDETPRILYLEPYEKGFFGINLNYLTLEEEKFLIKTALDEGMDYIRSVKGSLKSMMGKGIRRYQLDKVSEIVNKDEDIEALREWCKDAESPFEESEEQGKQSS